jgi:hypothetical protein
MSTVPHVSAGGELSLAVRSVYRFPLLATAPIWAVRRQH